MMKNMYLCTMTATKEQIAALRDSIEQAIDRKLQTPKDFDLLSGRIYARVGELLSRNTLRRVWGKIDEDREPRLSTLSILARFIGYSDFNTFITRSAADTDGESSSPMMGRVLSVVDGLTRGDRLRLTWNPGRVCDVEYNGSQHFLVLHSENTRLQPGDTFLCSIVIDGQPLYLDQLQQGERTPTAYVCGKSGGVHFEHLNR